MTSTGHRRAAAAIAAAVLTGISGLCLAAGGLWLAVLGGSAYYLAAGMLLLCTAVLLWRGHWGALPLFALVFVLTLGWALWESGLDWWPLAARLGVLFLLGALLLLPGVTRHATHRRGAGRGGLAMVLAAFVLVAGASWTHDPHRLEGTLPASAGPLAPPPGGFPAADWTAYGGTLAGQRYSALGQVTPANVKDLEPVWHFKTGDMRGQPGDPVETTFQATPLKIGNRLFFCTPHQHVIALDATTGEQIWRYDPVIQDQLALQHLTCRGLSWQPPRVNDSAGSAPPIQTAAPAGTSTLAAPAAAPMPALPVTSATAAASAPAANSADAAARATTLPVAAAQGSVDAQCNSKLFMPTADGRVIALNPDNGHVCSTFGGGTGQIDLWQGMPNHKPGAYYSTSPVVVAGNLLVVGGTVLDNVSVNEQSGVIRAFNIETGALVWNWDPARPQSTEPIAPGQTYTANSPNSWTILAADEALGLVYVPLGNQPPDQWGGNRTPEVEKYSSSIVALDLQTGQVRWSFQTVHHDLWDYDVPSQPSLLDLRRGDATVPVLVQPTKQGELFVLDRRTGEPVIPVTEEPAPQGAVQGDRTSPTQPRSALSFAPQPLTGARMWGATMFDQLYCRIALRQLRYEGRYTPPSTGGSLVYPGNFGVFNWGSIAVDPVRGWAFTTPAYLAFISKLVPRPDDTTMVVQGGKPPEGSLPALNENFGAPYAAQMQPFLSPLGIPCQQPPWGYVAGVDLGTGQVVWQHRNGTVRDLTPLPLPFRMGVPSLGGPLLTAGGVAFLSGTVDNYVRGYDAATGKELWRARLPAGGQATPMTYEAADGRQFVVVVAGGHGSLGTTAGDDVIAYALPR